MKTDNMPSLRVRVCAFLKRLFSRRKVVSLTVELGPAFVTEDGKRMYKAGYRTYVEESEMVKALDKAVEKGVFTKEVKLRHEYKD